MGGRASNISFPEHNFASVRNILTILGRIIDQGPGPRTTIVPQVKVTLTT